MFVPIAHPPGHAQADFGEAIVIIGGVEQKAYFFVMDLPHSDGCFVRAYPSATAGAWMDGCVFHGRRAPIPRDRGHSFHGIAGSHSTRRWAAGLTDGFMGSGLW